jgi:hypothetical protein
MWTLESVLHLRAITPPRSSFALHLHLVALMVPLAWTDVITIWNVAFFYCHPGDESARSCCVHCMQRPVTNWCVCVCRYDELRRSSVSHYQWADRAAGPSPPCEHRVGPSYNSGRKAVAVLWPRTEAQVECGFVGAPGVGRTSQVHTGPAHPGNNEPAQPSLREPSLCELWVPVWR